MANKPGKHLTELTKRMHVKPLIILKDKDTNAFIRNNNVITYNFKSFYKNLYQSELNNSWTDPTAALSELEAQAFRYTRINIC